MVTHQPTFHPNYPYATLFSKSTDDTHKLKHVYAFMHMDFKMITLVIDGGSMKANKKDKYGES